jgi:hypothetical protein
MGLLKTLFRTLILEDAAFEDWQQRPNLFLRGIVLIVVVALVAGLSSFGVSLVNHLRPTNVAEIEQGIRQSFEWQYRFNTGYQDPEIRRAMQQMMDVLLPMIKDLVQIPSPLPRGIAGFLEALGGWLSLPLASLGGWLFYGALVFIAANLLGAAIRLPEFLGMVSLYAIPGLLRLLQPIPCLGSILLLIGFVWGLVVYVKAIAVSTELDAGRAVLALFAPFVVLVLAALLLAILATIWLIILF